MGRTQSQNFDGIGQIKIVRRRKPAIGGVDSLHRVVRPRLARPVILSSATAVRQDTASRRQQLWRLVHWSERLTPRRYALALAGVAILLALAFAGGIWAALNTRSIAAENQTTHPITETADGSDVIPLAAAPLASSTPTISNQTLFNTPIDLLQQYFASLNQPDVVGIRTTKLKDFLAARNSPFASAAETIASQTHWKLILAISFAESTLGKKCADHNCSNIGSHPGSPIWHQYKNYQDWIVDFNRLLEKRYKDWTLTEMCGVYVKPCSSTWLLATQQILDQLQADQID